MAWLIPQGYGVSTSLTGGPIAALWGLIGFYVVCLALVRWNFLRPAPLSVEPDLTLAGAGVSSASVTATK